MPKEYRTLYPESLKENEPIEVELMDNRTMETVRLKAIVSSNPSSLPDADKLWVIDRSAPERRKLWAIKVLEVIQEEPPPTPVRRSEISLRELRGSMLKTLIQRRQEREKQKEAENRT